MDDYVREALADTVKCSWVDVKVALDTFLTHLLDWTNIPPCTSILLQYTVANEDVAVQRAMLNPVAALQS